MHSYYSKATGPILREKLAELARLSPDERHSLQGEIDLSRTMAERALRLYEAACFPDESKQEVDPKTGKIKAASEGAKAASQQNLVEALNFVGNLVSRASKVHAVNTATVDVEQLEYIVLQVTRIIEEEVADYDKAMADRVVERMRDIRMPERSAAGGTPQELAQQLRDAAGHIEKGMEAEDDDEEKSDA